MKYRLLLFTFSLILTLSCGDVENPDSPELDAGAGILNDLGVATDSGGGVDAGEDNDAGPLDDAGGNEDAGREDASLVDSGVPPRDTGVSARDSERASEGV